MSTLKLIPADSFDAPASIRVPGGEPVQVMVTWRHKGRAEVGAWFASAAGRDDADVLAEVILGWGPEIDQPYSRENLEKLLDAYPGSAVDLLAAYRDGLQGGRRKN